MHIYAYIHLNNIYTHMYVIDMYTYIHIVCICIPKSFTFYCDALRGCMILGTRILETAVTSFKSRPPVRPPLPFAGAPGIPCLILSNIDVVPETSTLR